MAEEPSVLCFKTEKIEFCMCCISIMERLLIISQLDVDYAIAISEFIADNPIFQPYLHMAALHFFKPSMPFMDELTNVRQACLYYICHSGVRTSSGLSYYNIIRNCESSATCPYMSSISQTKLKQLHSALDLPHDLTVEAFKKMKVSGIGVSGVTFICHLLDPVRDYELTSHTDLNFRKGLKKIYSLDKVPTATEALRFVQQWKRYKSIGDMFCFQANNYA
jgi:hypothetical protein